MREHKRADRDLPVYLRVIYEVRRKARPTRACRYAVRNADLFRRIKCSDDASGHRVRKVYGAKKKEFYLLLSFLILLVHHFSVTVKLYAYVLFIVIYSVPFLPIVLFFI